MVRLAEQVAYLSWREPKRLRQSGHCRAVIGSKLNRLAQQRWYLSGV
jgi:hypothetical protein